MDCVPYHCNGARPRPVSLTPPVPCATSPRGARIKPPLPHCPGNGRMAPVVAAIAWCAWAQEPEVHRNGAEAAGKRKDSQAPKAGGIFHVPHNGAGDFKACARGA